MKNKFLCFAVLFFILASCSDKQGISVSVLSLIHI